MSNPHCECPVAGFCNRHNLKKNERYHEICKGKAGTEDGDIRYWNAWESGKLGATSPKDPKIDPPGFVQEKGKLPNRTVKTVKNKPIVSKIGDRLQKIIERDTGEAIPCSDCKRQIARLNTMTVARVQKERTEIIEDIAERAKHKAPKLWQRMATRIDQALNIGETHKKIGGWLDQALKEEEESVKRTRAPKPTRRHHQYSVTKATGSPVEVVNFTEPVRRNLLYHIYPMKKNRVHWQWNLDQLIRRIDLFTGQRIVGIVTDEKSDPADMVKEYLRGYDVDFIVLPNIKKHGEGVTFLPMMKKIESFDANEITFRAHAKGVSKKESELPVIKQWTEMMYGVCLDDWQHVREQLEQFAITGPFRRFTRMGGADWFYSGSFYWFRNRDVFSRNWRNLQRQRVGIETWPHDNFHTEESGCLFGDKAPSLYEQRYTVGKAWPKYQEWLNDHIPNRVIIEGKNQHPQWILQCQAGATSLDSLYQLISTTPSDICEHVTTLKELSSRCETVTEFGTRYGVSTIALLAGEPSKMTSYDIERKETVAWIEDAVTKTDYRFVLGDTLKIDAIEPTDLLFIDTLHTFKQLLSELNRHGNQARKYIVFHDTVCIGVNKPKVAKRGLRPAIDDFLSANPEWSIRADFRKNNGLMVLGK